MLPSQPIRLYDNLTKTTWKGRDLDWAYYYFPANDTSPTNLYAFRMFSLKTLRLARSYFNVEAPFKTSTVEESQRT
ncbi:hypothetical protein ABKN59_010412 [Abortiporus biennis]